MRISGVLVRGPLGIGSAGIRILSPLDVSHVMAALPSRWSRCGEAVAPLAKRLPTRDPSAFLMLPLSPENRVQIAHLVDPPAAARRPTAPPRHTAPLPPSLLPPPPPPPPLPLLMMIDLGLASASTTSSASSASDLSDCLFPAPPFTRSRSSSATT